MSDQFSEEPRILLSEPDHESSTLVQLDDRLRTEPERIIHAIAHVGQVTIYGFTVPENDPRPEDIQLLEAALSDKAARRAAFDDASEDAIHGDPDMQALIEQMQNRQRIIIGKKRVQAVEENPRAIEDRNTIWQLRIATLALRRVDWNSQTNVPAQAPKLPMAS